MITFGNKGETLERLAPELRGARVLPQVRFTAGAWAGDETGVMASIRDAAWSGDPVIVRSSALAEDTASGSMAGKFLTVPNVSGSNAVADAVRRVIASFGGDNPGDQVFIQPMLKNVSMAGTAFSRDPSTGGFYVVINYDDTTGSTSSVTSGATNDIKTFYHYKYYEPLPDSPLGRVVVLVRELESLLACDAIDIEFAVNTNGELFLLQARPLVVHETPCTEPEHRAALERLEAHVREFSLPHPYLRGTRAAFGVMPDWNPAEMIGLRPRPLALSLYRELITDNIWAYQRDNYGYRNLRSFPLLLNFLGIPFIDIRTDFNSFIPADIDDALAERLVNYYMDRLIASPGYHDKIEFEIVFTCYTFDIRERIQCLDEIGFSKDERETIMQSLRRLTNRIIHSESGLWKKDIEKVRGLDARRLAIHRSGRDETARIYWLLEDCKRYGTLPFAGLARAGFIAVQLLRSLTAAGILSDADYSNFMQSLETVTARMAADLRTLPREEFMARYGHLRPGTYDILTQRYDEAPDRYFRCKDTCDTPGADERKPFALSLMQMRAIDTLLKEHRLEYDVTGLFFFIKEAIENREYAKFIFTKSLSDTLSLFRELAAKHGLTPEDAAFADIACIRQLYVSAGDAGGALRNSVEAGKDGYRITRQVALPQLILNPEDVWSFHVPQYEPNFITLKKVSGRVVTAESDRDLLNGGIVFIRSADPGYDWIFSHNIAAFVTMYGGANSHMAIRAGELGIPAVIGAGESLFNKWAEAAFIEINCADRQVTIQQ